MTYYKTYLRKTSVNVGQLFPLALLAFLHFLSPAAHAGVALGATRVIYPEKKNQIQLVISSNDEKGNYLIQSWIENNEAQKDSQFIVTPPLFAMKGKKDSTIRVIEVDTTKLPHDRESLLWLNVKAIPGINKEKINDNMLQIAITSRIKMYYRPSGLKIAPEMAPGNLEFVRIGKSLKITNPTPYYQAVTELTSGSLSLGHTLVSPFGESKVDYPENAGKEISWRTINDYGALSPMIKMSIK